MKKVTILTLILTLVFLAGCSLRDKKCGDGECQRWEERDSSCPVDCGYGDEGDDTLLPSELPIKTPGTAEPKTEESKEEETETEKPKAETPLTIKRMYKIKGNSKALDWSSKNNLILNGKVGTDGYYDVTTLKPDGSGEKCLTCGKAGVPQGHNGNAAWHPSGDYIVFTVEKTEMTEHPSLERKSIPGSGMNNDLYVMNSDGSRFWKIYDIPFKLTDVQGVIHPQFSHNGKMLMWAERLGKSDKPALGWGEWAVMLADFDVSSGEPVLSNIKKLQPGSQKQFYESHAFSHDDKKILFSGNLEKGQKGTGLDIYEYTISSGQLKNLTNSLEDDDWDEHAHWSPDGSKIIWISSTGYEINYPNQEVWKDYLKTELWVMNAQGSGQTQLTHFNTPGYPEYKNARTVVADSSWSPDGKSLTMSVAYADQPDGKINRVDLMMVEFE